MASLPLHWKIQLCTMIQTSDFYVSTLVEKQLNRFVTSLAGTYPNGLLHRDDKNLAVTDSACSGRCGNGLDDLWHQIIRYHKLQLDFWNKIHDVLGAPIELGMTFLSTESLDFRNSDSHDSDLV